MTNIINNINNSLPSIHNLSLGQLTIEGKTYEVSVESPDSLTSHPATNTLNKIQTLVQFYTNHLKTKIDINTVQLQELDIKGLSYANQVSTKEFLPSSPLILYDKRKILPAFQSETVYSISNAYTSIMGSLIKSDEDNTSISSLENPKSLNEEDNIDENLEQKAASSGNETPLEADKKLETDTNNSKDTEEESVLVESTSVMIESASNLNLEATPQQVSKSVFARMKSGFFETFHKVRDISTQLFPSTTKKHVKNNTDNDELKTNLRRADSISSENEFFDAISTLSDSEAEDTFYDALTVEEFATEEATSTTPQRILPPPDQKYPFAWKRKAERPNDEWIATTFDPFFNNSMKNLSLEDTIKDIIKYPTKDTNSSFSSLLNDNARVVHRDKLSWEKFDENQSLQKESKNKEDIIKNSKTQTCISEEEVSLEMSQDIEPLAAVEDFMSRLPIHSKIKFTLAEEKESNSDLDTIATIRNDLQASQEKLKGKSVKKTLIIVEDLPAEEKESNSDLDTIATIRNDLQASQEKLKGKSVKKTLIIVEELPKNKSKIKKVFHKILQRLKLS